MKFSRLSLALLLTVYFFSLSFAQSLTPALSPKATLTQAVGVSEITVTWSRPAVKGRKIWGGLIPFGEIWRTGANANTTIKFSDAVTINGKELPAATYGFHTIPGEKEWTLIISKDNNLAGSAGYKQENDALRLTVKPVTTGDFYERLTFDVIELTDSTAEIFFAWEKVKVSFTVQFKTRALIADKVSKAFSWSTPLSYASYIFNNDMDVNEGLKWIDYSTAVQENYWNLRMKARLLHKAGKKGEAILAMDKAMRIAEGLSSAPFDLEDMKKLLKDWKNQQ